MKHIHLLSLFMILHLASACSREKEEVDVRDELTGTYTLVSNGATGMSMGLEIVISKNSSHADRIDLLISQGDVQFYGSGVSRTENTIHFDIPPQASNFQGFPVLIKGEDILDTTSEEEHGLYLRAEKQLQLGISLGVMTPQGLLQSTAGVLTARRKE